MEEKGLIWMQEMSHGYSFGLTEDHVTQLLKVKGFSAVMEEMIQCIRPNSEYQQIRLNLRQSSLRKRLGNKRAANEEQKEHLSVASSIENARREVTVEAKALKHLLEEEEKLKCEEENLRCQIALLDAAIEDKQSNIKKLKKWSTTVDHLLPKFPLSSTPEDESIKLEAAQVDLKEILRKLRTLKDQLLGGESTEACDDKAVWHLVESALETHPPATIIKALSLIRGKEIYQLKDSLEAVDLMADAKALSLKLQQDGEFIDESSARGVLETVESMLVEMSGKHIKNHLKNHKKKQETDTAVKAVENITKRIPLLVHGSSDVALAGEVIQLFDETIKIAGLKAALNSASKLKHSFEARTNAAAMSKKAVTEKHDRIHHFEDIVEREVAQLKSLTLSTNETCEEVIQVKDESTSAVNEHVTNLPLSRPPLKGALSMETEAVLNVPIHGINSFHNENRIMARSPLRLKEISATMPYLTEWDNIVDEVRQKKLSLRQQENVLQNQLSNMENMTTTANMNSLSTAAVKGVCQKAATHDSELSAKVVPLLNDCETTHAEIEQQLRRLKVNIDEWWNQPGPLLTQYLKRAS